MFNTIKLGAQDFYEIKAVEEAESAVTSYKSRENNQIIFLVEL